MVKKIKLVVAEKIGSLYAATIGDACALHRPCEHLRDRIVLILEACGDLGIRRPNDFEFECTGFVNFRWYDGPGDSFWGSEKFCKLNIHGDHCDIVGRMERGYQAERGVTICGLADQKALTILKILLEMVDKPKDDEA